MLTFLNGFRGLSELWRRGLAAGVDPEMLPWQERPKCHALEHLVLDKTLLFGNPQDFWGYTDESFVGFVKARRCVCYASVSALRKAASSPSSAAPKPGASPSSLAAASASAASRDA